ncbi:MAG: LptF/LptG family permease [Candidatus Omnitrophica bacterium]|nr:LptF/LptG family permease [Candidatus Omnitrophota bacterium]MBL7151537.1 LptF/LptG family permease [Candidatus Omnitrophota bacterium]
MRILDRYILKSVVLVFLSCIFVFLFLYITIDILTNLEDILRFKVPYATLIRYYLSFLPIMFMQVSPFACLLSTLYAFGKLNHDNEIIAMRSSGMSIIQIGKTVIILGAMISLFAFWVNDRLVPQALMTTEKIREQMWEGEKNMRLGKENVITNLTMYGLKNRLYFIDRFFIATNTMEGITILEQDQNQNITKKIVANKGAYKDRLWNFEQCITYNFSAGGQMIGEPQYFEKEIMAIPESPRDFITQRQRPSYMTIAQLEDYIWKFSKSGTSAIIRNLKVDLYQKFSSPFTNVIIILLAIPFSLLMRRRATGLSSIGLSIMVGFLYYVLEAISIALGKGGVLFPALAATASHIIALAFGLYMILSLP